MSLLPVQYLKALTNDHKMAGMRILRLGWGWWQW